VRGFEKTEFLSLLSGTGCSLSDFHFIRCLSEGQRSSMLSRESREKQIRSESCLVIDYSLHGIVI